MKPSTKHVIANQPVHAGTSFWRPLLRWPQRLLALALMVFSIHAVNAAILTWDPGNTSNGGTIDAGSGTWDTSTAIWNNGASDVIWSQTSTTVPLNTAIFGGADGTYAITVGATQIATTNITFNNSGYTLTNGTIYIAHTADGQNAVTVAANKTASITNVTFNSSGQQNTFVVNGGATLNLGCTVNAQALFSGGGIINMNGGTIAPGGGFFQLKGCVFNHKGGTILTTGTSAFYLGYGGNSYYTNSGGTAILNNTSLAMGRGGYTAVLTLQNGSSMYIGTNGTTPPLYLSCSDNNANEKSYVDVQGGTLTVGSAAAAGYIGMMSLTAGGASGELASFTAEGGVVNAWGGFQFGAASGTYSGAAIASLLVSNTGALYVGSPGIYELASHASDTITFAGGTLGALANWSSSMNMSLGNSGSVGGPVTIQAANAGGTAENITLSGALSGAQGFTKTGGGILTLSGANTYSGATTVSAGELKNSTLGSLNSTFTVAAGATNGILFAGGQLATTGNWTNQASSTLHIDYTNLIPSAAVAPLKVANFVAGGSLTLQIDSTLTTSFYVGQSYPLVTWTGSGPGDASAFATVNLPSGITGTLSVSGNTFYLNVTGNTASANQLSWNAASSTWDTGTPNWTNGAAQVAYADPSVNTVLFDDASGASGNPTVTLNSIYSPLAVSVNSASHSYTISGTGGIAGSTSLSLDSSTLTLATANSYTGPTVINGGTLNLTGTNTASSVTLGGGGVLSESASGVIAGAGVKFTQNSTGTSTLGGTNTYTGATTVNAGTLSLTGQETASSITVANNGVLNESASGVIAGAVNLAHNSTGTSTLSGINTYTGTTTIGAGTLAVNGAGQLGGGTYAANITVNGALNYNSSAAQTLSGIISGTGALNYLGTGTLTLSGLSTYTGATTVTNGSLQLLETGGSSCPISSSSAGVTVNPNGTLLFNNNSVGWGPPNPPIILNGGTLTNCNTGNYTVMNAKSVTVNSPSTINVYQTGTTGGFYLDYGLLGSAALTINASGVTVGSVVLRTASSTYSGSMTVNGVASAAVGGGSGLTIGNNSTAALCSLPNATITVNGTMALGFNNSGGNADISWAAGNAGTGQTFSMDALNGSGVVVANFTAATTRKISVGNNNGSGTFSGVIAAGVNSTLSLIKAGTGTENLTGANTYTGTTTVNGGTLSLGNGGGAGTLSTSSAIIVNSGGVFAVNRNNTVAQGTDFSGAPITGAGGFTQAGSGTNTLNATNTYTGTTTISAGTLVLSATGSISNSTSINITNGATLDVSAYSTFAVSANNTITASGKGTTLGTTAAAINGASGGTVDLGTQNITLNYDGSHPALYVSQGALSLEGNVWTINGATLSSTPATYTIATVASGTINSNGVPTINVNGTAVNGLASHIVYNGGNVQLVVTGVGYPVTVNGLTANNKGWDGTTPATINTNGYTLSGVHAGDVGNVYLLANGYTANFANANVGAGKTVTVSGLSLGGSAAGSYFVVQPIALTASITNAVSTLALTCAKTNVASGWPYAFVAQVTSSSGVLQTNETVTFWTNSVATGTPVGTATMSTNGLASILAYLTPGTWTITAGYPGDTNVFGSTNTVTFVLNNTGSSALVFDGNISVLGAQDGSGNWDTTTYDWWGGYSNVVWNSAGATFGAGVDGTNYTVTLPGTLTATSLTFNNSGYTLNGGQINLGTGNITVAANKTNTINSTLNYTVNSAATITVNSGSALNLGGGFADSSTIFNQISGAGTVNFTGGNYTIFNTYLNAANFIQTGGTVNIPGTGGSGTWLNYGAPRNVTYTISGGSLNVNGTAGMYLALGRNTGQAIGGAYYGALIVQNGGTVNIGTTGDGILALDSAGNAPGSGLLDIQGGTLTVGNYDPTVNLITLFGSGSYTNTTCVMQQEGGLAIVNGIQFGGTSAGTWSNSPTATLTLTGGSLYLGALGISEKTYHATDSVTFSGGTVGATANWNMNLPLTLATNNGNVTFQCADTNANPYTITLQNGASGAGGLNVTGGGTLALGGTINYSGSTVVSNGTLVLGTTLYPVSGNPVSSGAVTFDGATGTQAPTLSVTENAGQYWSVGTFTYTNGGSPALSINLGTLVPSASVAPIQVAGNVNFSTAPAVTISGTAIPNGTFPLIHYTGSFSGTVPTSLTLPGYITSSGYITNIVSTKTIAMVISGSPVSPALAWAVGNNVWDINASLNWKQVGSPVTYADGSSVLFDDTASGLSPITVTLNTTVNPFSVTANNSAKSYTIQGTGGIAGSTAVSLLGSGTFTLAGTNTYSGGTTVSAGQLNINNGGDGGADSAIGTGPLTLAAGVKLDNTSGSDVTLMPSSPAITENWNGSFTYLGSTNSLNTGAGNITMNQSLTLTVSNNTFTVGGQISDSGNNYYLTKNGIGTLTLGNNNTIGGGVTLSAGQLNLGSSGSLGSGIFQLNDGSFDNVSGSDMTESPSAIKMFGSFTYLGSTNNLDLGSGPVSFTPGLVVTVVTNTLTTEGDLGGGNFPVTKTGNGTWNIIGSGTTGSGSSMIVNAGTVNFGKSSGWVIKSTSGPNPGLTVNSNAQVVFTSANQQLLTGGAFAGPVILNGGVLDLNGHSQTVDSLLITNSGTLRNSANYATLNVGTVGANKVTLGGTNCTFDVPGPELDVQAIVAGNGSLLMTGAGLLHLYKNNTYTGSTIINGGTLQIDYACLSTNSLVSVASNAVLNLNFATTNIVGSLVINGVTYPPGVYNNTDGYNNDSTYLTGSGSLEVPATTPPINPLPGTIQVSVSGSTLGLAWPTNAGWILQAQTNSLSTGLGTNWVDVPGSSATTNTSISIVPEDPAVFYRLRHP